MSCIALKIRMLSMVSEKQKQDLFDLRLLCKQSQLSKADFGLESLHWPL